MDGTVFPSSISTRHSALARWELASCGVDQTTAPFARRSPRPAAHQSGQNVAARGIADQGGDQDDVGSCFHTSMIRPKPLTSIKSL